MGKLGRRYWFLIPTITQFLGANYVESRGAAGRLSRLLCCGPGARHRPRSLGECPFLLGHQRLFASASGTYLGPPLLVDQKAIKSIRGTSKRPRPTDYVVVDGANSELIVRGR